MTMLAINNGPPYYKSGIIDIMQLLLMELLYGFFPSIYMWLLLHCIGFMFLSFPPL